MYLDTSNLQIKDTYFSHDTISFIIFRKYSSTASCYNQPYYTHTVRCLCGYILALSTQVYQMVLTDQVPVNGTCHRSIM